MSIKGQTLNIIPPFDDKESEVHSFENIICPNCNGRGFLIVFEDYLQYDNPKTGSCQRCNGSGNLKAKVVVKWSAEKE